VADVQGKGRDDLAVIKDSRDTISLLLNGGQTGFALPLDLPVGSRPIAIAVGDVNGDGLPDLITVNYLSGDASVVMNRGGGRFDPERRVSLGSRTHPLSLALGDFDGDGSLDIAVTFQGGGLSILTGMGNGDFSFSQDYAVPNPWGVAAGDFNGDGRLDLAVAGWDSQGQVTILYGAQDGRFQTGPSLPVPGFPEEIVVADFNADGLLDLAATARDGQGISVFLVDGKGNFFRSQIQGIRYPIGLTVGDFNRDGRLDLAFGNAYDGQGFFVAQGDGAGGFGLPIRFSDGYGRPVGVGDFSGSGTRDLAIASSNGIVLFRESGSGGFGSPEVPSVHYHPTSVAHADFNGDGLVDLAVGTAYSSEVHLILGQPGAGLATASSTPVRGPVRSLAVADLDGDGRPDLVVARGPESCLTIGLPVDCPKQAIVILLNRGGRFEITNELALDNDPAAVAVADLNRDGLTDVVAVDPVSNRVLVFLGTGSGNFRPPLSFSVGRSPRAVAVADFDGDGKLDLAVANQESDDISILLGQGDGTFISAPAVPGGGGPVDVLAADFDRDGRMDLAIASAGSRSVTLVPGIGDGRFGSAETLPLSWTPGALAVGDFDGDGYLELAVTNVSTSNSIFQDRASYVTVFDLHSAAVRAARSLPVGLNPVALAAVDLNSDGQTDLVTANADSDDISVLLGSCGGLAPIPAQPGPRVPRVVSAH
jgi:hypothetical protein